MKKVLLFAAVLFGLAACQNDPKEIGANLGTEQDVNILVSLDSGTRTSSADSAEGAFANIDFEAKGLTLRYIFQVWDEEGKNFKEQQFEYRTTPEVVSFPVRLIPGRNYNFVVWADIVNATTKEDNHYNTEDLSKISLNGEWNAMDETRDAYTGFWSNTYDGNDNITITLTRPFAKLRVVTDDMNELLGVVPAKATVSYSSQVSPRTSFNALTGKAGARCQETVTHNYGLTDNIYNEIGNSKTLFSDYFFVAESDIVNFTLTVKEANDADIITRTFNTAIPVKRNNLTTIEGNILTVGDEIKVNINDQFTQPGNDINIYSGPVKETITLESGLYIFNDLNLNTTEANAVVIAEGADVTIDIIGNVSLKSAGEAIKVPANSTLTINGVSETRNAERNGVLVVEAQNGSAIGGGNITIQNLAGLTAKANGVHAFGIGSATSDVTIENTTIDYVCGGYIQPLCINDPKYGKSEPEGGAAIGGAKVVIKNSTINKAEGGSKAAAIGNRFHMPTEIVIENSTLVDILGGNASAAIGGSRYNGESKHNISIKIKDSTIENAVGGQFGAGIGSGYDTHCNQQNYTATNSIVIENSNITAQGGKYGAGIGTGFHSAYLTGSIDAASTINATAGEGFYKNTYTHAQNIGYGIVDPAREFSGNNATPAFTVAGEVVATPVVAVMEGLGKIIKENETAYSIYNEDGLQYISEQVNAGNEEYTNANIVLDGDIDLSQFIMTRTISNNWTPIGTSENPFQGTFDGNNCTIKNLALVETEAKEGKAYIGFFGYAKNATIKNVTFENVYINIPCLDIDHSQGHIGAVAGSLEGTSTIENVTVKGDIKVYATQDANGASRVAVVAGGNTYGDVTMKNVHVIANEGSYLKANNNTGALAGQLQGKMVFENCSSNIDVTVNKFFAGGLVGIAAGDSTFTNCHTTGDVAVVAGRAGRHNDEYRVGGIAGGWADGKTKVCTLVNCSYTGEVSGQNADGTVANPLDYAGYVGRGYTLTNCAGSKVVIDDVEYVQVFDNVYGVYSVNGKTILTNDAQLNQAIASGMTEINLGEGTFNLPASLTQKEGTLTITGMGSNKTTLKGAKNSNTNHPGNYANDVALVIEGLTFETANTGYNGGFGHATSVTFRESKIVGQFYAHSGAPHYFYDCTIDPLAGYLYTYASDCLFEGCTFSASEGKALQVYEDGSSGENTVTINNCTFVAAKQATTWDGKPVTGIDINSNGAKFNVRITNSTSEGFPVGSNSGSNLWNVKDGGKAYANVYVDGVQVWYAGYENLANGLFKKDKTYVVVNANGLVALSNRAIAGNETVELAANIDLTGVEFNGLSAFNSEAPNTFDGKNFTVSNWTYNGGASDMGFIKSWVGTIKNVKFEYCHLQTSGRSAIVAANTYCNIDNVTVNNCSIEDSYWACGIVAGLYNSGSISNCTVTNSSVKSNGGTGGIVGVINETGGERAVNNCSVTNSTIHNTGAYGEVYSGGGIVGMLNASNATYKFTNCSVSNNTLVGEYVYEKYPANDNIIEE